MVLTVKLPLPLQSEQENFIPKNVIHRIAEDIHEFPDLLNFSLVSKQCYNTIRSDNSLWIGYLKLLGVWEKKKPLKTKSEVKNNKGYAVGGENALLSLDEDELTLTPIDCLETKETNPEMARDHFISIVTTMKPVVSNLLMNDYASAQSLSIFKEYNSPVLQAKLFSNVMRYLRLYKIEDGAKFDLMTVRLNTIFDLFIGTVTREIGVQLDKKDYAASKSLITALGDLNIDSEIVNADPLSSLLEFFMARYSESFAKATDTKIIDSIFCKETDRKKGAVNGYRIDFESIDIIFDGRVKPMMDEQLAEISNTFSGNSSDNEDDIDTSKISEVPIVLKVIESFLSNYLIGGLIDKIVARAEKIDHNKNRRASLEKRQVQKLLGEQKKEEEENITNQSSHQVNDTSAGESVVNVWQDDEEHILADKIHQLDVDDSKSKPVNSEDLSFNSAHINIMNVDSLFFQCVPYIHYKLISTLQGLEYPQTVLNKDGEKVDYVKMACQFVNFYYESYLLEFSEKLPQKCHESLLDVIKFWQSNKEEDRKKMEGAVMKMVDDSSKSNKKNGNFDMLSTFTNIFSFHSNNKDEESQDHNPEVNTTKISTMTAKLRILKNNVEEIRSLVSVDLVVLVLQHVKNSYDLILGLTKYSTTEELNRQLYQTCSNVFVDTLTVLVGKHIKPGFNEALNTLRNYNPHNFKDKLVAKSVAVAPLKSFIELVNVGDFILQMIGVFYERELVSNGIVKSKKSKYKDFLSINSCEKAIKRFEGVLDNYVADGLDISIGVIMNEINYTIEKCGTDESTYDITSMNVVAMRQEHPATDWVLKSVEILDTHFKLLEDTIDKDILGVFKQEIGERFVNIFIRLLSKTFIISVPGAMLFIADVNYLYNFFQQCRIKPAVQYFVSFKKISQLYLIDCSGDKKQCRELGKLVVEIGRKNGIFSPEEVYQFVTRRSDWPKIKKSVDKIMYGFSSDDCIIM